MQRYELTLLHVTASCNWYESLNLHRNQTKVQVDPRHRPPLSVGPACLVHGSVWQYPQTCQTTNPTFCGHLQPESLCNLQCFSLELILVCSISSYWTSWHWAEEGQQGPAAHVAPGPPHRSTRPFCSLFISAAALWKVKLLLSALLMLNLQEPDGWQAGLRSSGLQDQSKTEINHRPYGDDNTCAESECVIQNNKSSAASPPASCWKWNHVGQTGEVNEILSRR